MSQVSLIEYLYHKSRLASRMNEEELLNYDKLASQIQKQIENAKGLIEKAKEELQKAKLYRKNRMEYEVIANVIDKHPERKVTEERLVQIRKELSSLEVS